MWDSQRLDPAHFVGKLFSIHNSTLSLLRRFLRVRTQLLFSQIFECGDNERGADTLLGPWQRRKPPNLTIRKTAAQQAKPSTTFFRFQASFSSTHSMTKSLVLIFVIASAVSAFAKKAARKRLYIDTPFREEEPQHSQEFGWERALGDDKDADNLADTFEG